MDHLDPVPFDAAPQSDPALTPAPEVSAAPAAGPETASDANARLSARRVGRGAVVGATAVVCGIALFQAPEIWSEWTKLRGEWENARISKPIGFIDISPNMTRAEPPHPWFREEGETLLLWSGWSDGEKRHDWFKVQKGEIEPTGLILPFGRDSVRAIDLPIIETLGGPVWDELELDTPVADIVREGVHTAIPRLVAEKVEVINDLQAKKALLIVFTPFVDPDLALSWFDPTRPDGTRLSFGLSGLMSSRDRRPYLYDRDTESLWQVRDAKLTCVAGPLKGQALPALGTAPFMDWADWKDDHPEGCLIVGAKRPGTIDSRAALHEKPPSTAIAGASLEP
jgi:hypothetical protein